MEETDEPRISIPDSGIRDVSRDRQGRQAGGIILCTRERFDCMDLKISDDVIERIRGMENKRNVVDVYHQYPSQDRLTH